MSTVNPYPTFHYSQPEEYKFSHDSVFLARRVFDEIKEKDLKDFCCLDLCAGSGVVGLDLLFHLRTAGLTQPKKFHFLEIQKVYQSHFEENVKRLGCIESHIRFLSKNYDDLQNPEFSQMYDLIVANPPYFFHGQGKLSPSEFKNRCRFFLDSSFKNLFLGIAASLKPNGSAYLLLRDLPEYRWNVIEEAKGICKGLLHVVVIGDIRGTFFVQVTFK